MRITNNTTWHKTAEVVVVGYGLAGATTAITARSAGADVLILEKQSADTHYSNSSMSGGVIVCANDADKAERYLSSLCQVKSNGVWTDTDVIKAWARYVAQNKEWVEGLGGNIKFAGKGGEYPDLPGADSIELWRYQGLGFSMMHFMYKQVAQQNIFVQYQATVTRLITNESGAVVGVKATVSEEGQQKEINIKATRGVVLCCGGFEGNEAMKLQYLRVYPMYFSGGVVNNGEGVTMSQEVGAELWHMNCCSGRLVAKFPEFPMAFYISFGGQRLGTSHGTSEKPSSGYIIVDKYGRRYMSENYKGHAAWYQLTPFDANKTEYPRVPSYFIFDRKRMELNSLCMIAGATGPHQFYRWSDDNAAELERGWITKGNTISDLAEKLYIPAVTLSETIRQWNHSCEAGRDEFGRNSHELVQLNNPPYYAIQLFPGGPNTQGGPRRNSHAQVINPYGEPIPGLYAAGECGSIYGMLYPSAGSNLAECFAFGRIAGENVLYEPLKT